MEHLRYKYQPRVKLGILREYKEIQYNLDIIRLILVILHIIQNMTRNTLNTAEYNRLVKTTYN